MSIQSKASIIAMLFFAGAGCNSGRYTSAGFHLPGDGNAEHGKQVFASLGCGSCHRVSGVDSPGTGARQTPVDLGGEVDYRPSDAYLVTSMIDPSYQLAPYPKAQISDSGISKMPNYTDKMTVRQMVDVVEFLQAHYVVRQMPPSTGIR